ncbi:hypothetical protein [Mesorhizobium sp.]|uniref:hypothetical protein n=1 Tax=Mesorhizobium sp. TaxID=1871066 RepID=UPI000FE5DA0D|nr:hypothetical protein [Mesorhizobium sp.]RWM75097.1 MAG: hypothetical protein EOR81_26265 [Mesorhizobium sp.]RWN53675.1 MAG: hypothetical protein EOS00_30140 [Mesorhizobium sp.]
MLIAFPLSRRMNLISEICTGLISRKANGIPKSEIDRQIADYIKTVNVELDYGRTTRNARIILAATTTAVHELSGLH